MLDFEGMMNQAKDFQRKMKDDLQKMAIVASSGGGAVEVIVNGSKEITNIEFREDALRDPDTLAELVMAAVNAAYNDVEKEIESRVPSALDNMDLSAIMDMLQK